MVFLIWVNHFQSLSFPSVLFHCLRMIQIPNFQLAFKGIACLRFVSSPLLRCVPHFVFHLRQKASFIWWLHLLPSQRRRSVHRSWCAMSCGLFQAFQGKVCSVMASPQPHFQSWFTQSLTRLGFLVLVRFLHRVWQHWASRTPV